VSRLRDDELAAAADDSAFEITLCDTTSTSPFSKSAASAISAATSSPARISGRPSIGMTRSSLRGGP